ncbi:hypothetical protein CBF23_010095 [Marinomonas agarivorans]|nr:hypothetical protein CBF23_010095 [Marinomonas agarivorans]
MKVVILIAIYLGLGISVAKAEFQTVGQGEAWLIGGAIEFEHLPYQQTDELNTSLQPYVAYQWENLHIGVDNLSYNFFANTALSLTMVLQPRWTPTDNDSATFTGLERDDALEAGLTVNYVFDQDLVSKWYWNSTFFADISNAYKGHYATSALGFQREYSRYELDITMGLSQQSAELNHYLYGVNMDEANLNRHVFTANSSLHPFAQLSLQYQLTDKSLLISQVNLDVLDQSLEQSPLLADNIYANALIGWIRIF